jgi:cytochrome b
MQSSVVVEAAGHAKKKIVSKIFMHSNVGYFLKTVVVLRQSWNAVGYDGWSVLESVCVVKK